MLGSSPIISNISREGQQILDGEIGYINGLNSVDWDEAARDKLQTAVENSNQFAFCRGEVKTTSIHQIVN